MIVKKITKFEDDFKKYSIVYAGTTMSIALTSDF